MNVLEEVLGKKPTAEKQLERDRYIDAQINLLQSKLQRLERVFSVGMPLGEAEETVERLDQIEKGIKLTDSKINMFASVLKELKASQEKVAISVDDKANLNQVSMMSQRVKFLENIYGELSSSKTKDIFMNIVEIMKNLEVRIKTMEGIAQKNVSLLFQKEISDVREEVVKGTGSPSQGLGGTQPVAKQQSAGDKIRSFFGKLFGRE